MGRGFSSIKKGYTHERNRPHRWLHQQRKPVVGRACNPPQRSRLQDCNGTLRAVPQDGQVPCGCLRHHRYATQR
nr:MAG TPA: hypothetical protein [Caudoviricetes sp.]